MTYYLYIVSDRSTSGIITSSLARALDFISRHESEVVRVRISHITEK